MIQLLDLQPHIEGGYFRRTYCSDQQCNLAQAKSDVARALMSSILYLLTSDSPIGHLHRNQSDIVHYYQGGGSLCYWLLSPAGELSQYYLGWHTPQGPQLQLTVPGGYWKASELVSGDWGLISEAVSPGFDYRDMTLATPHWLEQLPAAMQLQLRHLIKTG